MPTLIALEIQWACEVVAYLETHPHERDTYLAVVAFSDDHRDEDVPPLLGEFIINLRRFMCPAANPITFAFAMMRVTRKLRHNTYYHERDLP